LDAATMKVSIIIPALNEQAIVAEAIERACRRR
jgi:glycosyltransferase involved in cell wall biosynthesis